MYVSTKGTGQTGSAVSSVRHMIPPEMFQEALIELHHPFQGSPSKTALHLGFDRFFEPRGPTRPTAPNETSPLPKQTEGPRTSRSSRGQGSEAKTRVGFPARMPQWPLIKLPPMPSQHPLEETVAQGKPTARSPPGAPARPNGKTSHWPSDTRLGPQGAPE